MNKKQVTKKVKTAVAKTVRKIVKSPVVEKAKSAVSKQQQLSSDLESRMLHLLMDNIPDHIYFKDDQSRFIRINKSHAEAFGLTNPADAVGKTDFDFFPIAHAQDAFDDEKRIMHTGKPVIGKIECEVSSKQSETWVFTTKMPIVDDSGKSIGTFGISRDITAIKSYETALRKAKDELEQRVAERTADLKKANEGLETRISQLDFLTKMSYEMSQHTEIENRAHVIADAFASRFPKAVVACCVLIGKKFECKAATGIVDNSAGRAACENLADLFLTRATKQSVVCDNWKKSEYEDWLKGLRLDEYPFFCFIPLLADNSTIGMIFLFSTERNGFSQEEKVIATLSAQAALSLSNAIYYKESAEKARLQGEANAARSIQYRLVPSQTPSIPHINLKGHYSPAFEVSGDYLDYFKTDKGQWVVVIADVCGKGIPAAMVMTMLRSAFRTQAEKETNAKGLMCAVNNSMRVNLDDRSFITALCCMFDEGGTQMTYARAGHPGLIRLSAGVNNAEVINPRGVALGLLQDEKDFATLLEERTIPLVAGDRFLLYTDGLTEAINPQKEFYGTQRLTTLLSENTSDSPKDLLDCIVNDVKLFVNNAPRNDDMTIIAFTVLGDS